MTRLVVLAFFLPWLCPVGTLPRPVPARAGELSGDELKLIPGIGDKLAVQLLGAGGGFDSVLRPGTQRRAVLDKYLAAPATTGEAPAEGAMR